eukprot:Gb_10821 [translate_table: standard]
MEKVCGYPMFGLRNASLDSRNDTSIRSSKNHQWTSVPMTVRQVILLSALMGLVVINASNTLNPDGEVLLAFKSQIIDSDGVLIRWKKEDPDPCGWKGVTCDPRTKRVIFLNLPYHKLRGSISPEIGKLSHLRRLALHDNNFYGTIPPDVGNCTQLRALYLQDNFLSGWIPPEFGKLSELKILDISSNTLGGSIPASLGKLTKLSTFNVSTNFLIGEIPSGGALNRFSEESFVGNLGLCGKQVNAICRSELEGPVPSSEPPVTGVFGAPHGIIFPGSKKKRGGRYSTGLLISALATVGISLLVALMCFWGCFLYHKFGKKYKRPALDVNEGTSVVIFHGDLPYSSKDIIRKIETLDEDSVIGSGGFGTVYKLAMDDGNVFALKKIEKTSVGSDRLFERELEILGSIKHRHLVNLRGYCNAPLAKLLIYDYLPGGNLDEVLHEGSQNPPLDWDARLKIAIGAAKGLAYLHHDCSPRIIHRDIKSSNILLDRNMESHVSDFGLAKLLEDRESHITTIVAGTFGYLAPEYMHSGRATEKADVYSFGVLLLELLSRKRPTDSSFIEKGLNVVGWLNLLVKENRQKDIIDPHCEGVQIESFEALLHVAIQCVAANPENRPTMHRVVQLLESEDMTPCPSDFYDSE